MLDGDREDTIDPLEETVITMTELWTTVRCVVTPGLLALELDVGTELICELLPDDEDEVRPVLPVEMLRIELVCC